jgi:hypothetical protein
MAESQKTQEKRKRPRTLNTPDALRVKAAVAEAAKLRILGLGYRQIGERMGVTASTAHKYVTRAAEGYELQAAEAIDTQRKLELARLDHAMTVVMSQIAKLATSTKPNPAAIDQLVRVSERRAKLLGLDAALEVKVQQAMGNEIDAVIARLRDGLNDEEFAKALAALGVGSAEGAGEPAEGDDAGTDGATTAR